MNINPRNRRLAADSVEKVDPSKLLAYWLLKMPFSSAATRKLSPESSAKIKTSISSAYFFAVETMADFFNRIGQKQTVAAVLISPDSERSQHATAYLKPSLLTAYAAYPFTTPLSVSVGSRTS